jgi:CDP-glycerol:poly(glycerophosphate) glycerophosphotransferase
MSVIRRKRILFSGAAWVHFVCVLPVYKRLSADPRIEFWLSGGFKKEENDSEGTYTLPGFYDPFPVDRSRVIPVERAREEDFDVLVAAHKSPPKPRSFGKSVQLFHGVSFKNLGVREKYLTFDHLCLAGPYHGEVYRKKGFVRTPGQVLLTGVPKLDCLVTGELDRDALLRKHGLDPRKPTILYAPTGSRFNSMETMGKEVIEEIRRAGTWNLLIKLHDHPKNTEIDWPRELAPFESDRIRLVREPDVVPFLHAADLLLTDASSVSVEYTLLDRPIVFLDVPELLKDVVDRGGALDLETHGRKGGVVVKKPGEVVAAIADSLAHPGREAEARRATVRHVFHDPGRATERAAGVVLHAAGLAPGLPEGVEALRPEVQAVAAEGRG